MNRRSLIPTMLSIALLAPGIVAQHLAPQRPFGTLREQAQLQQEWLTVRLDSVLPLLMRQHGIDMWVVAMREYNEDPVFRALVSPTTFAARRRTIYIFFDRGPEHGLERLALGGSSQEGLYETVRGTQQAPDGRQRELWGRDQWRLFADMVRERNPATVAVNISADHNFSDGLSAGEWRQMSEALGQDLLSRVVHAELLPIDYLSIRVPGMSPVFRDMMSLAHEIIKTAFSNRVITPGVTTTADVVWWMRQQLSDRGLGTWFQTSVDIQRRGGNPQGPAPVIERGDVLHCDFGITALGLNTDTQHMGYVLRQGEADPPEGLKQALQTANWLQDIVMDAMHPGRTGNEALSAALAAMQEEGIDGTVYSHPVGDHGHGAGPLIGLWDRQDGVPGRGDVPIRANTWYAIELQAATHIPEWDDQLVRMMLEEDADVTADGAVRWILRRQTEFHIVR
ncbi:MAG: aminopeptidase P family protein [Gemmatimonadota bacterium]|nr:MAG: aminopeptidase P family protein [Gemmatimonadota bacterium]